MHTRCPKCRTTFKVTPAQLAAREGLVRCGKCSTVFSASEHLVAAPAAGARRASSKRAVRRGAQEANRAVAQAAQALLEATREETRRAVTRPHRRHSHVVATVAWSIGSLLSVTLLIGQFLYFFSVELARDPALRPAMAEFCDQLGCELGATYDVRQIELADTSIAPHPRYLNALRIRATLINRAPVDQPYPLLEVSLTDSQGRVLARRHFRSPEYLDTSRSAEATMLPNVAIGARLDVTAPDNRAVGYEIQLVSP